MLSNLRSPARSAARGLADDKGHAAQVGVLVVTGARLLLTVPLVIGIGREPSLAVGALLAIMLFDIADGVLARRLGLDGPSRRLADAAVDKAVVAIACIAMVVHKPELLALYVPLAARDVALVLGSSICLARKRVLILGASRDKLGAISVAVLGLVALTSTSTALLAAAAAVAWLASYVGVPSHIRAFRAAREAPRSANLVARTTSELVANTATAAKENIQR